MPQELLRDVLRAGDASSRARRGWRLLPLSIALHALALAALMIIPLTAEVDPPDPPPPSFGLVHVMTVAPPPGPPAPPRVDSPPRPKQPDAAPIIAPEGIRDETPPEPSVAGPPGMPDLGSAGLDPNGTPGALVGSFVPFLVVQPPVPQAPVRPGGVIREPRKLVHVPPEYPSIARAAGVEGVVILEAVLDERGAVADVRVIRSVTLLNDAAVQAVRRWRYTPTLLNGVPVQVLMTITVQFKLDR